MVFSKNGKILFSSGLDNQICFWDVPSGKVLHRLPCHKDGVYAIAVSPDGTILASAGGDGAILLWSTHTRKKIRALKGHTDKAVTLAFSPDGRILASGGYDRVVRLWDSRSGDQIRSFGTGGGRITQIAFSPDGHRLITAGTARLQVTGAGASVSTGQGDFLRIWDVNTGERTKKLACRGSAVAFAEDGTQIIAAGLMCVYRPHPGGGFSLDGFDLITRIGLRADETIGTIESRGQALALSPDGKTLATGRGSNIHAVDFGVIYSGKSARDGDTRVRLWELDTWHEFGVLGEETAYVLAFSPDGRTLAAGLWDGRVVLWNLAKECSPSDKASLEGLPIEELWHRLGDPNAAKARSACWRLTALADKPVAFLQQRLLPVTAKQGKRVEELIGSLGDPDSATRDVALAELKRLGRQFEPVVRRSLAGKPLPEAKGRLRILMASFTQERPGREFLQTSRAIQVLEQIGSAPARRHLSTLAGGYPFARATQDARAAVKRLSDSDRPDRK